MSNLSAADIAEGRRLMQALADPRTGSEADERMAIWLFGHLPALLDAAEKVAQLEAESLQAARYDVWLKCHRGVTDSDWNEFLEADSGE